MFARKIYHIGCLLLLTGLLSIGGFAQSNAELMAMYRESKIDQLEKLYQQGNIHEPGWRMFVEAIFIEDAETATVRMMEAYLQTALPELQQVIRERISNYYAARGYYETARRILEDEHSFREILAIKVPQGAQKPAPPASPPPQSAEETPGERFGVQIGAFSTYDGAETVSRECRAVYANTEILEKEKDGDTLYVVVIGGYPERAAAEHILTNVNQQFKVKGYIIQY